MMVKLAPGTLLGGFCLLVACCCRPVLAPRGPIQRERDVQKLEAGMITEKTKQERRKLMEGFELLLKDKCPGYTVTELAREHPIQLISWIEYAVKEAFKSRQTLKDAGELVNSVQSAFPFLKGQMAGPRRLLSQWLQLEPAQSAPPITEKILLALATTACSWGWAAMAVTLVIGFYGLLRPMEYMSVRLADCLKFSGAEGGDFFILRIMKPKTRYRGALHQTVRIDMPLIVEWLDCWLKKCPSSGPLWNMSPSTWRNRLRKLLQAIQLPPDCFVPSSLRTGGATFLFQYFGENVARVQWRGRWQSAKMLEIYLQELQAALMLRLETALIRKLASLFFCFIEDLEE
eukprot:TRINITY_DN22148_c0_g1_i1.p2 TRINITY_DN22148_c0_g1~~TRINITY_DN22148_c0_g1_i1.p2  ORF type:complete len:345 (+),score=45.34 TRINITY_DN22148_c0_g1_i1:724-1758(+)